ncbi:MAG: hypothetical protein C5B53_07885 [Candidatus Melainabacteria bacterium]|nr:MAG: hypothetical protein C5B53_07885 [Candidatus Melainabacteria bacterium]
MGLFESKISKGTVAEAASMVEIYYSHRGLNAGEHRLSGTAANEVGFWLKEGSAQVYIVVQESEDDSGAVLRISSPIVFIPQQNKEAFYRRLLDINANLSCCALATHENIVLVVAQRHTIGLTQEEMDELVWNVAFVADLLDNKLANEFGAQMYSQAPAQSLAGQKST